MSYTNQTDRDDPQVTTDSQKVQPKSEDDPNKPHPKIAKYIRRADWGASPPKWIDALKTPINKVVLTWAETEPCFTEEECKKRVREIQRAHLEQDGIPDIKHNFLVGGDGALYEGRGFTRVGPNYPPAPEKPTEELTGKSIEIAFIQGHQNQKPSEEIVQTACDCVAYGRNFIDGKFTLYWAFDGHILHSAPVNMDLPNLPK